MKPIESLYDTRFVTLISVVIQSLEELALLTDHDPNTLLAEYLYKSNKELHEIGEHPVVCKFLDHYPLLNEAIK